MTSDGAVSVFNTADYVDLDLLYSISGTATFDGAHGTVTFPSVNAKGDYRVVETDYETYSLVYACVPVPFDLGSFQFMWILAREKEISEDLR